jgi:hypothetical protein
VFGRSRDNTTTKIRYGGDVVSSLSSRESYGSGRLSGSQPVSWAASHSTDGLKGRVQRLKKMRKRRGAGDAHSFVTDRL